MKLNIGASYQLKQKSVNQFADPSQTTSGLPFEAAEINYTTSDQLRSLYLLVTLFPVSSARAGSTVIGLDNEGVLLLLLAVYETPGPQHPFTRCPVQHLSFKWGLLPMNLKCTNLSWKKQDTGGRISGCENTQITFFFRPASQQAIIAITFTQQAGPPTPEQ